MEKYRPQIKIACPLIFTQTLEGQGILEDNEILWRFIFHKFQRVVYIVLHPLSHANPLSVCSSGILLDLFARESKTFQSKSTNSNSVSRLQPKKRPIFPPISPETGERCPLDKSCSAVIMALIIITHYKEEPKLEHSNLTIIYRILL